MAAACPSELTVEAKSPGHRQAVATPPLLVAPVRLQEFRCDERCLIVGCESGGRATSSEAPKMAAPEGDVAAPAPKRPRTEEAPPEDEEAPRATRTGPAAAPWLQGTLKPCLCFRLLIVLGFRKVRLSGNLRFDPPAFHHTSLRAIHRSEWLAPDDEGMEFAMRFFTGRVFRTGRTPVGFPDTFFSPLYWGFL